LRLYVGNLEPPVLPLRNAVLFPGVSFPISAGRAGTLRAIDEAMKHPEHLVFAISQREDVEKVTPRVSIRSGRSRRSASSSEGSAAHACCFRAAGAASR